MTAVQTPSSAASLRLPGRDSCGTLGHTFPDALATSICAHSRQNLLERLARLRADQPPTHRPRAALHNVHGLGIGLRHLNPPTVVTLTLSEPITAALLATLLLHQDIGLAGWIGVPTVMAALVITARGAETSTCNERSQSKKD